MLDDQPMAQFPKLFPTKVELTPEQKTEAAWLKSGQVGFHRLTPKEKKLALVVKDRWAAVAWKKFQKEGGSSLTKWEKYLVNYGCHKRWSALKASVTPAQYRE